MNPAIVLIYEVYTISNFSQFSDISVRLMSWLAPSLYSRQYIEDNGRSIGCWSSCRLDHMPLNELLFIQEQSGYHIS